MCSASATASATASTTHIVDPHRRPTSSTHIVDPHRPASSTRWGRYITSHLQRRIPGATHRRRDGGSRYSASVLHTRRGGGVGSRRSASSVHSCNDRRRSTYSTQHIFAAAHSCNDPLGAALAVCGCQDTARALARVLERALERPPHAHRTRHSQDSSGAFSAPRASWWRGGATTQRIAAVHL